ncbi:unnamed protein product [Eretmochelys imbricata]
MCVFVESCNFNFSVMELFTIAEKLFKQQAPSFPPPAPTAPCHWLSLIWYSLLLFCFSGIGQMTLCSSQNRHGKQNPVFSLAHAHSALPEAPRFQTPPLLRLHGRDKTTRRKVLNP